MSYALIDTTDLTALGDAIRAKTSTTATMSVSAMADAVDGISVGGGSSGEQISSITVGPSLSYWNYMNSSIDIFNKVKNKLNFWVPLKNAAKWEYYYANEGSPGLTYFWAATIRGGSVNGLYMPFTEYGIDLSDITINFDMDNEEYNEMISADMNFARMFNTSNVLHLPKFRIKNNTNNLTVFPKVKWANAFQYSSLLGIENDDFDSLILSAPYYGASNGVKNLFQNSNRLRYIPNNFLAEGIYTASSAYTGKITSSVAAMPYMFNNCYFLKKIIGCPYDVGTNASQVISQNTFTDTFKYCFSLHRLTFYQPNGQVGTMRATGQTIDLSQYVGWWGDSSIAHIRTGGMNQNSATFAATLAAAYGQHMPIYIDDSMVNDSDIITKMLNENSVVGYNNSTLQQILPSMAVYNRQSAIETINSLPDTSAAGGGNTIKFKAGAGSAYGTLYDMDELTAAEIAVATAKGWTVSLV